MNVTATSELEVSPTNGTVTPAGASTSTPAEKATAAFPNTKQPKKKSAARKKASPRNSGFNSTDAAADASAKTHTFRAGSKGEIILKKLKSARGATIDELVEATGWQSHSVRGFMSGTVKKKLGLEVAGEPGKDGVRRYRIADGKSGK